MFNRRRYRRYNERAAAIAAAARIYVVPSAEKSRHAVG